MGNSQSADGAPMGQAPDPLRKGYHVLKVRDHSPAYAAGLLSYFHFIVAVNGQSLDDNPSLFPTTIKASVDQPVLLTVYSARSGDYAELSITPQWWTSNQSDGLIGCSIRYCDYQGALMHVWHVVEVLPQSPAQQAGLVVDSDYIVGTPEIVLREQQDLYALIAARGNEGKPLRLFVYSTVHRAVRDVTLCPRKDWGGQGLIGAELGYGALHRIPVDSDSQYEDTDDEATHAHQHAHASPSAPPVADISPVAGVDSPTSLIHTSPTVMYQQQPPASGVAAANTNGSETAAANDSASSFTVLGQVPSFGTPAHSKYARTLATNLPLGPQEIKPATEFAAMRAPPTDALLAQKRASVDHGQAPHAHGHPEHAHGPQCDHHSHVHHDRHPPVHQQDQPRLPPPKSGGSTSPPFVPMTTATTSSTFSPMDHPVDSHARAHPHTEQLHILTPPPPVPMLPPPSSASSHSSPAPVSSSLLSASASATIHDGDVVPLVAADPPAPPSPADGLEPVVSLDAGRSPSPLPYAQQPQSPGVPSQPAKSPSPPSPQSGYLAHQSPTYAVQHSARSPSPVRPPAPLVAMSQSPPPPPFFSNVPAASPTFIADTPGGALGPELSAFSPSAAAPLDLSTFGAPLADAPQDWVPQATAAPPVPIPGYHAAPPAAAAPGQQPWAPRSPPTTPNVAAEPAPSPPFVPAAAPAIAPAAVARSPLPPQVGLPAAAAAAASDRASSPPLAHAPVSPPQPSWVPVPTSVADTFAPTAPSTQHAPLSPRAHPARPTDVPLTAPRSPSPAPGGALPQSPAVIATNNPPLAPSWLSPSFSATAVAGSPSPALVAAAHPVPNAPAAPRSPSPVPSPPAPAATAPRSVSPFTALFGSDPTPGAAPAPAPEAASQGAMDFLSFIPQSPPQQPAAEAQPRSPPPAPASPPPSMGAPAAVASFVAHPASMTASISPVSFQDNSATYSPSMFDSTAAAATAARSVSPQQPPAAAATPVGPPAAPLFGGGEDSVASGHSASLFDTFGISASAPGNDPFASAADAAGPVGPSPLGGAPQPPPQPYVGPAGYPEVAASTSLSFSAGTYPGGSSQTTTLPAPAAVAPTTQAIQDLDDILDSMSLTDPRASTGAAPVAPVQPTPPAFVPASASMNAVDFFDTLGAAGTPPPATLGYVPAHTPPAFASSSPANAAAASPGAAGLFGGPAAAASPPVQPSRTPQALPARTTFSPAPLGTNTPPVPAALFGNASPAAALFGGADAAQATMPKSSSVASVSSVASAASGSWNPPPDQGTNPFL